MASAQLRAVATTSPEASADTGTNMASQMKLLAHVWLQLLHPPLSPASANPDL